MFQSLVGSVKPQASKTEPFSLDELNEKAERIKDEIEKLKYKTLETESYRDTGSFNIASKTVEQLKCNLEQFGKDS